MYFFLKKKGSLLAYSLQLWISRPAQLRDATTRWNSAARQGQFLEIIFFNELLQWYYSGAWYNTIRYIL